MKTKFISFLTASALAICAFAMPVFAAEEPDRNNVTKESEVIIVAATDAGDQIEEELKKAEATYCEPDPDGSVLTMWGGVNYYFDQKETYYNLDMSGVVSIAHSQGIEGEYWVRDDGCKMLGDYIMIAANRNVHPQGSLVPTSLGMGIVVDTGGFAVNNPTQVDIAVNW